MSDELAPEERERRLRQKAEMYEKLKRGEIALNDDDDDERGYMVDFVRKGYLEQEAEERDRRAARGDSDGPSFLVSDDMLREQERKNWERLVEQGTRVFSLLMRYCCSV